MSNRSHYRNKRQSTTPGLSRRQQHNADKRRSANAVGLTDFSQKKGQVRALEEFKKRKNRKQLQTSMALRKYRKLMKQEGIEAGTGASRKRRPNESDQEEEEVVGWNDRQEDSVNDSQDEEEVNECNKVSLKRQRVEQSDSDDDGFNSDNDINNSDEDEELEQVGKKKKQTRPKKMDPFEKSREKAKLAKQRVEEAALRRETNEKERQQKLRRRRQQTKLLQQRTKRGQPIMKHAINNLLYKLEKQQHTIGEATSTNSGHRQRKHTNRSVPKTKQDRQQQQSENPPQKKKKKARKFY